jgi:hypothetical protein
LTTVVMLAGTVAATFITRSLIRPKVKAPVKKPTTYVQGMEVLKTRLSPSERKRLDAIDSLYEKFFDHCTYDLNGMRKVSGRLDEAMCLSRGLDPLEKEIVAALKEVAKGKENFRIGLVATTELMVLLRRVTKGQLSKPPTIYKRRSA